MQGKLSIRRPTDTDLDVLYCMIQESTCGRCKITKSKLSDDLFGSLKGEPNEILTTTTTIDDPVIDLDINLINSNRTSCQAFVAEIDNILLGHVIFHYHYSPWIGHAVFIDNVYVKSGSRILGIAKGLLRRVSELGKSEGLPMLLFNSNDLEPGLLETVKRHKARVVRDNNTDWSVLRIDF